MTAWIIEDHGAQGLAPLCDLRATFEQRTGGLTTLERLTKQMGCSPSGFICEDESRAEMISNRTGLARVTDVDASDVDHPKIETPWAVLDNLPALLMHDLENAESTSTRRLRCFPALFSMQAVVRSELKRE